VDTQNFLQFIQEHFDREKLQILRVEHFVDAYKKEVDRAKDLGERANIQKRMQVLIAREPRTTNIKHHETTPELIAFVRYLRILITTDADIASILSVMSEQMREELGENFAAAAAICHNSLLNRMTLSEAITESSYFDDLLTETIKSVHSKNSLVDRLAWLENYLKRDLAIIERVCDQTKPPHDPNVYNAAIFASTMELLMKFEMPLLDVLEFIISRFDHDSTISAEIDAVHTLVSEGISISQPLFSVEGLPEEFAEDVSAGENVRHLLETMTFLAEKYQKKVLAD